MSAENLQGEPPKDNSVHEIKLGVGFKPFETAQDWYGDHEQMKIFENIPECYDHTLYLRKPVYLQGVEGRIDVISEKVMSIITMLVTGKNWRLWHDRPFGYVERSSTLQNGELVSVNTPALLRFSFLLKNPSDYAKLMRTYGIVEMGEEEFFMSFMVNQDKAKGTREQLEEGKGPVLLTEKNLFNLKKAREIEEEAGLEDETPSGNHEPLQAPNKQLHPFPDRLTYVDLPVDYDKLKTIKVTFHGHDDWEEGEYPTEPVLPNGEPLPVLAR